MLAPSPSRGRPALIISNSKLLKTLKINNKAKIKAKSPKRLYTTALKAALLAAILLNQKLINKYEAKPT